MRTPYPVALPSATDTPSPEDLSSLPAREPANNSRNSDIVLSELAERYTRLNARSAEGWVASAHVLLEAREAAEYGQWLDFLKHAGIKPRTAQDKLRVARAGLNARTIAHLDVGETLRALRHTSDELIAFVKGNGGTVDDAVLYTYDLLYAQEACRDMAENAPESERGAILCSMPDGPFSIAAWFDFLGAMADAETDTECRAAWELRPWRDGGLVPS